MKVKSIGSLMLTIMILISACSPENTTDQTADEVMNEEMDNSEVMLELTLEELATYNGKDGKAAYVAIEGVVYDVTGIPAWTGGTHNGNMAGQDLTEAIKQAPHGDSKLDGLTIVGKLIEESGDAKEEVQEPVSESTSDEVITDTPMLELTLDGLAMYDGIDGNAAYVAVDGVVYDVTGIAAWAGGKHNGNLAGMDVTEALKQAPHGDSKLDDLVIVGKLVEGSSSSMETSSTEEASVETPADDAAVQVETTTEVKEEVVAETEVEVEMPKEDMALELTIEELAMYDGQSGRSAYVAIEGVIYDVTGISAWTGGSHNGNMAGQDLTEAIKNAPHGDSKLDDLTVVGSIIMAETGMDDANEEETMVEEEQVLELTRDELLDYDGQDGRLAYVAVDGIIYDVTGIAGWANGKHNGNLAGQDLSVEILSAPHRDSKLDDLEVVGKLVD